MSEKTSEQLSALLDGELDAGELGEVVSQLKNDPQLLQSMGRYHLIGDAIRGELSSVSGLDVSSKVMHAIESSESTPRLAEVIPFAAAKVKSGVSTAQPAPYRKAWFKPAAGVAVAASVALATVVVIRDFEGTTSGQPGPAVAQVNPAPVAAVPQSNASQTVVQVKSSGDMRVSSGAQPYYVSIPENLQSVPLYQSQDEWLNHYVVNHSEYTGRGTMQGMVPYARVVTYEPRTVTTGK